jgi:hypothetical protein
MHKRKKCLCRDHKFYINYVIAWYRTFYLTFVGPCIVIYLYSKTKQMHNISKLFYFGTTLYMFRTGLSVHYQESKTVYIPDAVCTVYFYSKTNQMHNISNLFYFGTTLYMFWTVSPSIIRSLRLYMQHKVYVIQVLWLLGSKWPSETCRVFQN